MTHDFVVVSNRLPVDRVVNEDGSESWRTSPGGLVTAMESVVNQLGCVWVGWPGSVGETVEPFEFEGIWLEPVSLNEAEFAEYYEGFSNDTLWPLYHDVISRPSYHRDTWNTYVRVNERFAEAAARVAAPGATVWVHDYQLQLVPGMLRERRPDLTIAFFLHIPFPARGLFSQLPWRAQVIEGLLGADVVGFQRIADAANFRASARRHASAPSHGNVLVVPGKNGAPERRVLAQEFPISIDTAAFDALARTDSIQARAKQIREELGNPKKLILGVDRLDYTKGIRHRLKAYEELLQDGDISPSEVTLVQVANPSRERVEAYRLLRNEIEVTVSRINGDHGSIADTPVVYLHRGYPREEMAALYLAADVLVVTSLRDGMNLVAKEYVACRFDEQGALVLSEFAGAADELLHAVLVNPHDIDGMKGQMLAALNMSPNEQRQRMQAMRHVVFRQDVAHWSQSFLRSVEAMSAQRIEEQTSGQLGQTGPATGAVSILSENLDAALRRLASEPELLIATDFDGTIAPIVSHPSNARVLPRAEQALHALQNAPGTRVAVLSGRSLESLAETGLKLDGRIVVGSHGGETIGLDAMSRVGSGGQQDGRLTSAEVQRLETLVAQFELLVAEVHGAWVEHKPHGIAVHTRAVSPVERGVELLERLAEMVRDDPTISMRDGKQVREFAVRRNDKGSALKLIRAALPVGPVLFIGDDVTDEDALRTLGPGDVGVHVGSGSTVAEHRVADPEGVALMLARLVELRLGIVIATES